MKNILTFITLTLIFILFFTLFFRGISEDVERIERIERIEWSGGICIDDEYINLFEMEERITQLEQ